jgi:hypothetical protein
VAEPDISADPRRFPPPWTAEETDACFIVRDHNGQALAYVYFEDEPGRRKQPWCKWPVKKNNEAAGCYTRE